MSELFVTSEGFEKHTSPVELEALFAELKELRGNVRNLDWQGTPNIDYHFFLSGHSGHLDLIGLDRAVAEADVVMPEVPGWGNKSLVAMRNIANGKKKAIRPNPRTHSLTEDQLRHMLGDAESLQRILFNTGKRIEFIDLPFDQAAPLHKEMFRATTFQFREFDSLDEMVDHFVYAKSLEAKFQLTRELHMLQSLDKLFAQQQNPLKVLISLGMDHTFITHQLMKRGEKVRRTFYPTSFVYPYRDELARRLIFGFSFDSDLVMRALTEGAYAMINPPNSQTTNTVEAGMVVRSDIARYDTRQVAQFLSKSLARK